MSKVKPIPDGYHTATPYIVVDGAVKAIEFYKKAFGAEELFTMPGPDGKVMHGEFRIGSSPIMISDENPEMGARGPKALGGSPQFVFECVGAEGMLSKAVMHAAQFGKIVSLGFCTSPDAIIPGIASYKCVSMQFAVGYSMKEFLYIADQMDKGHCDPKAIITNEIALTDLPNMFDVLRGPNNETKVHVCMPA